MNIFQKFLEKAYTEGIYADTPANRKLGRVGMSYKEYAEKISTSPKEEKWKYLSSVDKVNSYIKENIPFVKECDLSTCKIDEANKIAKTLNEFKKKDILKGKQKISLSSYKFDTTKKVGGSFTMYLYGRGEGKLKIASNYDATIAYRKRYEKAKYIKKWQKELDSIPRILRELQEKYIDSEHWYTEESRQRAKINYENYKNYIPTLRKNIQEHIDNVDKILEENIFTTTQANTEQENLIHELGHMVNASLQVNYQEYPKEIQDLIKKIKKKNNYWTDSEHLIFQFGESFLDKEAYTVGSSISCYSQINGDELFAEAFLYKYKDKKNKISDPDLDKLMTLLIYKKLD